MKQSFIKLGEGLTDLFEFNTLIEYNFERIDHLVYFHSPKSEKQRSSVALIMKPTSGQHFQAMYIMLNALNYPYPTANKKFEMINNQAAKYNIDVKAVEVQPLEVFHETELYFNFLTSFLILQIWIPHLK